MKSTGRSGRKALRCSASSRPLALYKKYTDKFEIDDVPEAERNGVAEEVAELVLARLAEVVSPGPSVGYPSAPER